MVLRLPPPAASQPHVTLDAWHAFLVLIPEIGKPTLHVVGEVEGTTLARITSPVVALCVSPLSVKTSSGRIYRLDGPPVVGIETEFAWQEWVEKWSVTVLRSAVPQLLEQVRSAEEDRAD